MSVSEMLPHKTKPKCKRLGLSIEESLDILDIDKKLKLSYADLKRGAIETIRKELANNEIKLVEFVESFETNQCWVSIYKSDKHYKNEYIYVLTSVHKNNGKILIRFGNAAQIASIRNSYRVINL